ncbi:MAG: retropepsin-like aspartic protease family protein [Paracoccaceae bacterium]
MSTDHMMNLLYLAVLGSAIALWFFAQNRQSKGRTLQYAAVWGLIFAGTVAGIGLWGDIRQSVLPRQSVIADTGQIVLPIAQDGHYYATLDVNGTPIRFVVDTGASQVVLSRGDAARAGIKVDELAYTGSANTANGRVRTAPVRLDSIALGPFTDARQMVFVNDGEMRGSLLGMSYLHRFSKIEISDGALTLTR